MEKIEAIGTEQQRVTEPPQSFAPPTFEQHIHRKPVPDENQASATVVKVAPVANPDANVNGVSTFGDHEKKRLDVLASTTEYEQLKAPQHYTSSITTAPSHNITSKEQYYNAPLPPLPTTSSFPSHKYSSFAFVPSFLSSAKAQYTRLSKRGRYILFAALAALVILIIGLAAGLSVSRSSRFRNLPLPSSHGGPYTGDLTYYDPGLGACGITSTSSDFIVAVSHILYDAVSTGSNPNANPLCGKKIRAARNGKSVELTVVDRCTGCKSQDLDVTQTVFAGLAGIDQGRVSVSWSWLEDVPTPASGS